MSWSYPFIRNVRPHVLKYLTFIASMIISNHLGSTNGTLANDDSSSGVVKFILRAFSACEMILKSQPASPYNE